MGRGDGFMKMVEVKLFGAFRRYVPSGKVMVELSERMAVPDFKVQLGIEIRKVAPEFDDPHLVSESALANDHEILAEDRLIEGTERLAILPPVCGG